MKTHKRALKKSAFDNDKAASLGQILKTKTQGDLYIVPVIANCWATYHKLLEWQKSLGSGPFVLEVFPPDLFD